MALHPVLKDAEVVLHWGDRRYAVVSEQPACKSIGSGKVDIYRNCIFPAVCIVAES